MKIVVVGLRGIPNIQGGVETHCEQLYTRIAAHGHDVTILGRRRYMNANISEYKGVTLIALRCPSNSSLEALIHTFFGVFKSRKLQPDILHIHAIGPSLMAPLAKLLGMKVVSTNHGPDYQRVKWGYIAKIILHFGEYLGCRFSDTVIAISEPIAQKLLTTYGCKPVLIPNGVVVRARVQTHDQLNKYEIKPGHYFLAVARLVPEKGLHDLLDAFMHVQPSDWKLVIAGRADHADQYSQYLMQKAESIPGVVMAGFVSGEPLAQLYSHAGLFVIPSYHEGMPIVLLEAMSYGLAVLASDIPANRQAGLSEERFFAVGNVDELAKKMLAVKDYLLNETSTKQQVQKITKDFDWDVITETTLAVYSVVKTRT